MCLPGELGRVAVSTPAVPSRPEFSSGPGRGAPWLTLNSGRCDHCLLDRLDRAGNSEPGLLLQRALELEYALNAGVTVSMDEIAADEFWAMRVIQEERERCERETAGRGTCGG